MFTQEIYTSFVDFSFFLKGSFIHLIKYSTNPGHPSFLSAYQLLETSSMLMARPKHKQAAPTVKRALTKNVLRYKAPELRKLTGQIRE